MLQHAVKPLVPEAVYTDRQEFIDYFWLFEHSRNDLLSRR